MSYTSPIQTEKFCKQLNSPSLFWVFLNIVEGPSLDWSKIQKLPEDAVMNYTDLKPPNREMVFIDEFYLLIN